MPAGENPTGHLPCYAILLRRLIFSAFVSCLAVYQARSEVSGIRLDSRLDITLWAGEPKVVDPVSIAFDANGVAYVAECRDYPYGVGPDGRTDSAIRRLEDTDRDGVPDKVSIFARGLSYATSVLPWRDGVLVVAPPEILFLRDTNGDGQADSREVVVSGIHRGVSDANANSLRYHPDGRIHVANGSNGGKISSPKRPGQTFDIEGCDFAFDPDSGEILLTARTGGGFGLVFDEWGRWFTTHNINHVQHRFFSLGQALRNPAFPAEQITGTISDHGSMAVIYPISTPATRPNHPEQAGHFSSAGGMGICLSSRFPAEFQNSLFVCDVVGNLVHRDVIQPDGPVFKASRPPENAASEFLASTDPAFRPVGIETGPDGALYLLDMQRDVIEHPDYIPAKIREKLNLRSGDDRGRVYRITPKAGLAAAFPNLQDAPSAALVDQLGNPDAWWRLTAQRLLHERKAVDQTARLRDTVTADGRPLARMHALWTLRAIGSLNFKDVSRGLTDANPGVRENALQIAQGLLPEASDLHPLVVRLAQDSDPRIRFQAAQTLGYLGTDLAVGTLRDLYRADSESPWTRLAILTALRPADTRVLLMRYFGEDGFRFSSNPGRMKILRELGEMAAANASTRADDFVWLLSRVDATLAREARFALLEGIDAGLQRSDAKVRVPESVKSLLNRLANGADSKELIAAWQVIRRLKIQPGSGFDRALAAALKEAVDQKLSSPQRSGSIRVLEFGSPAAVTNTLAVLLSATEPPEIQAAAFDTLVRLKPPGLGEILVARWPEAGPAVKGSAGSLLVDWTSLHDSLLGAVESGAIKVGELNLDLEQRRRLLRHATPEIQTRAAKFWSDEEYSNRRAVVDEWLAKLPATGDSAKGRIVFEAVCARCHRVGNFGAKVGPELAGVAHRSVEDLLSNILDPNMAMNPSFAAYTAEIADGESVTGLLVNQTADSVVLLQASEREAVVPRRKLKSLKSSGLSLMPEGLEAGRTPQEMRDLIAFIQENR